MTLKNMTNRMSELKENRMSDRELLEKFDIVNSEELNIHVTECKCEYCGETIYAIWDCNNIENYWPYPGNSVVRQNVFKSSPMIQQLRKLDGLNRSNLCRKVVNTNARIHSKPSREELRFSDKSIRILCNDCFRLTYNRILVRENGKGQLHSLSVVESRGETVESLCEEFGITNYEVLSKGAISDYI